MAAQPAQADFTSARCTGSNVVGRGASFANTAHAGWISYFSSTWCPGGPSVTYEPQGSGAGRRVVGERTGTNSTGSQSRNQVPRFGMTDEPPSPTGQGQMNLGTDNVGDEATTHVIPGASGAVVLAVNFPNNCDRALLPDSAETDPLSANASPFIDRVRFTRTQFEAVWNGDSTADNWTEVFPTLATDTDCNVAITRVVRFDDSGTTYTVKDYLHHLNGARGWLTTYTTPDTRTWPNATVAARPDCAGSPQGPTGTNLTSGCANGNGPLVQKLLTVDGGIGYSDVATARANGYAIAESASAGSRDDDVFWTQAPNPSSIFREPTDDPNGFKTTGNKGSDCDPVTFTGLPASTTGDWSNVSGVDSPNGYVVCTLTYGLLFDDYRPPYSLEGCGTACEEQKARTVRDYWAGVVSDGGQATLPGNDYDTLPLNILEMARTGVQSVCWDKAGGACPVPTNYPRPGGGSPLRVPLMVEYDQCLAPNSQHVPPLANPSCTPPVGTSTQLTTSTAGGQSAFARYDVQNGNVATPADEADLKIQGTITNVLNKVGGTNYTGQVILTTTIRVVDKRNGDTGVLSGTVQDTDLGIPVPCTGGSCSVNTTVDALAPNFAREGKRAIISMRSVSVKDAGPNGTIGSGCPLSCGNGDETVYLRQGVFIP